MGWWRKGKKQEEGQMEDISRILNNWEFNAEDICARKIVGQDGREKLQVRVDLGMLQMNLDGRPDGTRPHGVGRGRRDPGGCFVHGDAGEQPGSDSRFHSDRRDHRPGG